MVSVLFVCLGNICRSPMAEAVFRHLVQLDGLTDKIQIDSAGTYSGHSGNPPHKGTQKKLKEKGISYTGVIARHIEKNDLDRFTYVIGMDNQNVNDLYDLTNYHPQNIYRFVDFIPNTTYTEIPDPYYTGDFDETYQLVSIGCQNLLKRIKDDQGWNK